MLDATIRDTFWALSLPEAVSDYKAANALMKLPVLNPTALQADRAMTVTAAARLWIRSCVNATWFLKKMET